MVRGAKLVGLGAYVPERILTNRDLETMVDTTDEWIVSHTGMKERHIAAPDQATSDLALFAAQRALADDITEGGVDVLNLQDLVNGVDWIADKFRGRICVELDIDRQRVTPFGTPAEIDRLIRTEVEALGSLCSPLDGIQRVDLLPYHHTAAAKYQRLGREYRLPDTPTPSPEHLNALAQQLRDYGIAVQIGG